MPSRIVAVLALLVVLGSARCANARGRDAAGLLPTRVPDARTRAAAQRDLEALPARILRQLKAAADEDGIS